MTEFKKEADTIVNLFLEKGAKVNHDDFIFVLNKLTDAAKAGQKEWKPVIDAWINEGSHPFYHKRTMSWLKLKWPTLYRAITKAIYGQ